jgi:hypothetical protein
MLTLWSGNFSQFYVASLLSRIATSVRSDAAGGRLVANSLSIALSSANTARSFLSVVLSTSSSQALGVTLAFMPQTC